MKSRLQDLYRLYNLVNSMWISSCSRYAPAPRHGRSAADKGLTSITGGVFGRAFNGLARPQHADTSNEEQILGEVWLVTSCGVPLEALKAMWGP